MTKLAKGFAFSGIVSGLRSEPNRRDIGAIYSEKACNAAGVFTQNRVCAAPVTVSKAKLPSDKIHAIVTCSGNANACTGEQGIVDAQTMMANLASHLKLDEASVLVASTGIIGRPLPMKTVTPGIEKAATALGKSESHLSDFAHSVLTTDTCIKTCSRVLKIAGVETTITGISKGAAMIGPNMATMLGFIVTDANVASSDLQTILKRATDRSFNCISVEGHMSTNDTVYLLANGAAGGPRLTGTTLQEFDKALQEVAMELAQLIAKDAEGATHLLTLEVDGLRTEEEARTVAKTIAESALVKTAFFGADPNWGRIVSAAGYSGVKFEEKDLTLWIGPHLLYEKGRPLTFDEAVVSKFIKENRDITVKLKFTIGNASCRFWTCDLSYDYVKLNADYTT